MLNMFLLICFVSIVSFLIANWIVDRHVAKAYGSMRYAKRALGFIEDYPHHYHYVVVENERQKEAWTRLLEGLVPKIKSRVLLEAEALEIEASREERHAICTTYQVKDVFHAMNLTCKFLDETSKKYIQVYTKSSIKKRILNLWHNLRA